MNSKLHQLVLLSVLSLLLSCTSSAPKQVSEAAYKNATKHMDRSWNALVYNQITSQSWNGDEFLIYAKRIKEGTNYILVNTTTKEKQAAFDHQKLAEGLNTILNKDYTATTLPLRNLSFEEEHTELHFTIGSTNYVCKLKDYSVTEATTTAVRTSRNEHLSPNGKLAAYIDNYNLWVRDLERNTKTQLTFDGQKDYGYATNNAGWIKADNAVLKWSPNSDKIATFQQDARGVGEMYLTSTNVGHPKLEAWKHPLPGDKVIFTIERVIIHLGARPKMVRLKMDKDYQRGTTTDHIAGRGGLLLDAQWKADGSEFAFVSSSRDHKEAFENAKLKGLNNPNEYMYMYSQDNKDYFKNINYRNYINFNQ